MTSPAAISFDAAGLASVRTIPYADEPIYTSTRISARLRLRLQRPSCVQTHGRPPVLVPCLTGVATVSCSNRGASTETSHTRTNSSA